MSKHTGKLFSVLILGGAVMAQANELPTPINTQPPSLCQVEVVQKKYSTDGELDAQFPVCVDNKTTEEIVKIVEEAKEESCMSPFCGCWLG